jgi:hypothetical protein
MRRDRLSIAHSQRQRDEAEEHAPASTIPASGVFLLTRVRNRRDSGDDGTMKLARARHSSKAPAVKRRLRWLLLAASLAAFFGCKRAPPAPSGSAASEATPAPAPAPALLAAAGTALRAVAADLNGNGRSELVLVDSHSLRVVDMAGAELARTAAPSGIQVLATAPAEGGGEEVVAGWGRTLDWRDGRARVSVFRLSSAGLSEQVVLEPSTSRHDIADIASAGGELWIAWFESKYRVRIDKALRSAEGWRMQPIAAIRMATSIAAGYVDGDRVVDLVVGRTYGDDVGQDGDAFLLRANGERVPIPIQGGVRAIAVADADGDGTAEVYVADGWNRDYGRLARGLLTRARWTGARFESEVIDDGAGQYGLSQIIARATDGGRHEVITRGNAHVRVVRQQGATWQARTVASGCRDVVSLAGELLALCEGGTRWLER